MKTYLNELKGQVRGNARLRGRIDRLTHRVVVLERWISILVLLADKAGHGDAAVVVAAAREIGWHRMSESERRRVTALAESMLP